MVAQMYRRENAARMAMGGETPAASAAADDTRRLSLLARSVLAVSTICAVAFVVFSLT